MTFLKRLQLIVNQAEYFLNLLIEYVLQFLSILQRQRPKCDL